MKTKTFLIAYAILSAAAANAATINTMLTVSNASGQISGTSIAFSGPATLTTIGNGTFTSTVSITGISGSSITSPYTITLSDGSGTLTGTVTLSTALLTQGGSGGGSAAVTGGTGTYAGATGSFPSLSGTGSLGASGVSVSFSGAGTITTGGGGGNPPPGAPTVTSVVNNYSYIPPGFSNSNVAPSSLILIFGTGMANAPTGPVVLESSGGSGIPKSLNGASIKVTVGGTTVTPAMYYAIPTQIAAVLPANTPTGSGMLTVSYQGADSNAFPIQVVPAALGLDTYYGTGSGLATATDAKTGALINYTHSASPGQKITLWGSGLGADPQDSDTVFSTTPHAVNQSSVQAWFGNLQGTVTYAGSSGYPGVVQINVIIPASVTTGCGVSVAVVVKGVTSNILTAPINPGGGECKDAVFGITGSQFNKLGGQSNVKSGNLSIGQFVTAGGSGGPMTNNFASGNFTSTTGASYSGGSGFISIGSCIVNEVPSGGGGGGTSTGLDAGAISVKGPTGTFMLLENSPGVYGQQLPADAISSTGGTFVFTGAGGKDVGALTATVTLPNPILDWTNQSADATVTISKGVEVDWTGGSPGTLVVLIGSSSSSDGASGTFICFAPQSALKLIVPSYVTGLLPAGSGSLFLENSTQYEPFTATGIDIGHTYGYTATQINATFQ